MSFKRSLALLAVSFLANMVLVSSAAATIMNPRPDLFGPDDGGEIFAPLDFVLSAEVLDRGGAFGTTSTPPGRSIESPTFGRPVRFARGRNSWN